MAGQIRDYTDSEARAALPCKWGAVPEGTLPAWVAEMDYAPASAITAALNGAVGRGVLGYPPFGGHGPDGDLEAAFRGFAERHWGWSLPAGATTVVGDVVDGIRLALDHLCPPGPVVIPLPCYPPFREVVELAGREARYVALDPDAERAELDLDAVRTAFDEGARTLLLCSPHNPWGRVFTRAELEAVRDLAAQYDARVVADEIHAPLVLPGGAKFTPYLDVDPTGLSVLSHSKSFNTPGLKCAQLISLRDDDREAIAALPHSANHGWSVLGMIAGVAAWRDSDLWLLALRQRLDVLREDLSEHLAERLPQARMRPLEATYLAWIDLRAYGVSDPATLGRKHGVRVAPGHDYQPGLDGHVRLNIATSADRLEEIVTRLAKALTA
ncbi:MalY/PatB family protein [Nocardioides acrostichi]|uniref:cysteine-S-conjugate beta-lyase n=1 Tax=Nocardioides acrostichi TaxID=2784339 RepID=A0A930UWS1_9ACTN|nr:aminotransferase class I/II-fold pyridoxal phosphate-dependent enzyme [Nocardioides acrostichi]MBF4161097.1 aminotransferase class I/II-fold pyridoxal phosphate-dependent enzyme [Nocardioides acrostichi]